MATREEVMQHQGVLSCPTWCEQDADNEQGHEEHIGPLVVAVLDGGDDEDTTIQVRARRGWWTTGYEADCVGHVEVIVVKAPADGVHWLNADETDDLIEVLTTARSQADDPDSWGWMWAYPGAEDDAESDDTTDPEQED